ncbi:MAG: hypothetical protein QM597_04750, partial [Aeromicrobium sp.]|uniref:DUF7933 domain-containing protein n=1 Tax=Aeromicrobium sp. TaxID=1871063 RepID=UPI0039E6BD59
MKRLSPVILSGALVAASVVVVPLLAAAPASAVAGTPGEPQDGVTVFHEDFEGVPPLSDEVSNSDAVALVGGFTGVDGNTYTADEFWATTSAFNGIVLSPYTPNSTLIALGVTQSSARNGLRTAAAQLGALNGTGSLNHVVSAYTGGSGDDNLVEFATNAPVQTATSLSNRFLTFSVNVSAVNCTVSGVDRRPQLNFYFDDDNGLTAGVGDDPISLNASPVTPCGASEYVAPDPVLWTDSDNPYIVLRNANGNGIGNDHAFDDIQMLDVSPQLDKEFVPVTADAGGTARVRFTVTNTTELGAKNGWAFTDSLPLPVADDPNVSTACYDANGLIDSVAPITSSLTAGESSVSFTGNLASQVTYCTMEFDVQVPDDAGLDDEWTNAPDDLSDVVGLNLPAEATLEVGDPLFGGCSNLVTFDTEEESETWRRATVDQDGVTINIAEQPVEWVEDEGNPAPSIYSPDLQGGTWTEVWTPDFASNGYSSDFSFMDDPSEILQFDYLNDTGIGFNIYVSIVGANDERYWYNFRDQIVDSTAWNRVRVPMDPSLWHTGVVSGTGVDMSSSAPSAEEFSAVLADVDRFVISVEGRSGSDQTWIDNFGQPCDDLGDAPSTYGTSWDGENGASHRIVDLDEDSNTSDLMLGSLVDDEADGTAAASGD